MRLLQCGHIFIAASFPLFDSNLLIMKIITKSSYLQLTNIQAESHLILPLTFKNNFIGRCGHLSKCDWFSKVSRGFCIDL